MKKLYTENKFKAYSKKRAESELKRNKVRQKKYQLERKYKQKNINYIKARKRIPISVPENFSIIENTDETLSFFTKINSRLQNDKSLFFDMSNVRYMTLDALLYIKSIFDFYHLIGKRIDVKGNSPDDPKCSELLLRSGFFDDVRLSQPLKKISGDILKLKSGNSIERTVVKDVIDFSLLHLNHSINSQSRGIYRILLEMMGNTHNHAYKNQHETSKWYLIAHHEKNDKDIKFAFLDAGYGIPTTIKKYPLEKLKEKLKNLITSSNDPQLIDSALKGEFRTRTEKGYRGKGLPSIYKCFTEKHISDLRIISNRGFIDRGETKSLNRQFQGTLFTWNFI